MQQPVNTAVPVNKKEENCANRKGTQMLISRYWQGKVKQAKLYSEITPKQQPYRRVLFHERKAPRKSQETVESKCNRRSRETEESKGNRRGRETEESKCNRRSRETQPMGQTYSYGTHEIRTSEHARSLQGKQEKN